MNKIVSLVALAFVVGGCEQSSSESASKAASAPAEPAVAAVPAKAAEPTALALPQDPKNIVSIAGASADHTTLVTALKAADYLYSISNPGPFTVFAPTNAAFDALPKGTVEGLVKPEKKEDLRNILKYHVTVSTYDLKALHDGDNLGMANGQKATVHVKNGKTMINDATIIASIPASNGIIHVVDKVLLPPAKQGPNG